MLELGRRISKDDKKNYKSTNSISHNFTAIKTLIINIDIVGLSAFISYNDDCKTLNELISILFQNNFWQNPKKS